MLALALFASEGLQTEDDDALIHLDTGLLFIVCFHILYFISFL